MHTAVFTMLLVVGADGGQRASTSGINTHMSGSASANACDCDCENQGHGHKNKNDGSRCCWGDMPQQCYIPSYGCYPGNERFMNRYPAFSGTYYRAAYNYRNLFDYPWHAGLREPASLFAYNVPAPVVEEESGPPARPRNQATSAAPTASAPRK